jgi:hypothetical protein
MRKSLAVAFFSFMLGMILSLAIAAAAVGDRDRLIANSLLDRAYGAYFVDMQREHIADACFHIRSAATILSEAIALQRGDLRWRFFQPLDQINPVAVYHRLSDGYPDVTLDDIDAATAEVLGREAQDFFAKYPNSLCSDSNDKR